jgi:tetratricopeptide (TPR) repeat protein
MIDNEGASFYTRNNAQFLRVYYWLGVAQVYNGYDKSIATKSLEKAKLVYETARLQDTEVYQAILNDLKYIGTSLDKELMIGLQYAFTGQNEEVISYFKEFMAKLNMDIEQHRVYHAQAVQMIGNALVNLGEVQQAQLIYIDEVKYLESVGLTGIEAYRCICDALSVVYNQLHSYNEAYKWGMKAKAAFEKAQVYNYPYIRCLANLALSMSNMGQSVWAKILIDVVMENIDKGAGLDNNVTTLISSSSQVSSDSIRTQYDLNINKTSMVALLSNAAMIYESVGCLPDAISAIKRAVDASKKHDIKAFYPLNNLAYFYLKDSQYENAEKYFKEAESYATTNYEKNEVGMNLALAQLLSSSPEATATAERYSNQINHCINNDFLLLTKEERDFYWKHYRYYLPIFNMMMAEDTTKLGCIYNNVIQTKGMLLRTYIEIQDAIQSSSDSTMREKYQHLQELRSELNTNADTNKALILRDSIETLDRELTTKLKLRSIKQDGRILEML